MMNYISTFEIKKRLNTQRILMVVWGMGPAQWGK